MAASKMERLFFLILQTSQGHSQNLKQAPQNFLKAFNAYDVTLTSQLMTSYRKTKIASEKIISYRVTSPSNHCCQISIIVRERPGILVTIHFPLFLSRHSKIFKLLKQVYSYVCMLTHHCINLTKS